MPIIDPPSPLDRWARWAPWLIVMHVALSGALRVALSPWLEVDEADFYGIAHLALAYGNSHPPLYNWLLHGALRLTDDDWALSAALVKFPLLAAFHLLVWDAARRLGGVRAGMWALAASALAPQIVWMSALTLTHSILAMAGAAAVIHALAVLGARRQSWAFAWLGVAMALGMLGKFNFPLFLVPMLAAVLIVRDTRPLLADRRIWITGGVFAVLAAPALIAAPGLIAAALQIERRSARMQKLFSEAAVTSGFDLPGVGIDGALSLGQALVAWAGPLALVWFLARRQGRGRGRGAETAPDPLIRALGLAMVLSLAAFAILVLAADMHRVRERYLTPMLIALPIWLAVARPIAREWVARLAVIAHLAAAAGVAGVVTFSAHRLAYPWTALAEGLSSALPGANAVVGGRSVDGANIALALGLPVVRDRAAPDGKVLLVWVGDGPPPSDFAAMLPPHPRIAVARARMTNLSDKVIAMSGALADGASVIAASR